MNNQEQLKNLFLEKINDLTKRERDMIRNIVQRSHITRNTNKEFDEQLTLGQRMADRVASFGGSWTFIIIFGSVLLAWIALNTLYWRNVTPLLTPTRIFCSTYFYPC